MAQTVLIWNLSSRDWFSNNWFTNGGTHAPPVSGNRAQLDTGTITLDAADPHGTSTIDGITIGFAGQATLDAVNETFGAGMLVSDFYSGHTGYVIARGSVAFEGTLQAQVNGLTLDLQAGSGNPVFTNTGTMAAAYGSNLTVIGTGEVHNAGTISAGMATIDDPGNVTITASLVDSNQMQAGYGATLSATGGVSITTTGTIAEIDGAVSLGGGVVNSGAITGILTHYTPTGSLAIAGQLTNTSTGRLVVLGETASVSGSISNAGSITVSNAGSLSVLGDLSNTGTVVIAQPPTATLLSGTLTLGGALANSGQISETYGGDLQITGSATNTGSIGDVGGALAFDGGLTNSGTLIDTLGTYGPTGALSITGALTNSSGGNIILAAFTETVTGSLANAGSLTLENLPGYALDALSVGGGLSNSGFITIDNATLAVAGDATNTTAGTIAISAGTANIGGTLANSGVIDATRGVLDVSGTLSGSGTVDVGTDARFGAVAAGQTLAFTQNDATITIAGTLAGTVSGMQQHDVLDIADATTANYDTATHLVSVFDGTATVSQFTLLTAGTVGIGTDGQGGAIIVGESYGGSSDVVPYIVSNDFGTALTPPVTPANYVYPNPTIYYAIDSGWSAADISAIHQAMTMYADIADLSFTAAGGGHTADLVWSETNGTGQADANRTIDIAADTISSVTIGIDTTVPGWESLDAFGTSDLERVTIAPGTSTIEDFGGYGYMTALHELGHAIGFGHSGPYDDSAPGAAVNYLNLQKFYTDTRQYSIMSYLDASQSGADWVTSNAPIAPQTPMMYDIAAAQLKYGTNTASLSGHDTIGFHANFGTTLTGAHALAAYNFDENPIPVLTIYDTGPANTLDLSGFSTNDTVDLNQGHFSDVAGLTGNIAIAYGAIIDTVVGGSGNDIFIANAEADTFVGGSGTNTVIFSGNKSDYTINGNTAHATVTLKASPAIVDTLSSIATLQFADTTSPLMPCFVQGTRILTARGEVAVQALRAGEDRVITHDGRLAPVVWLGWRAFDPARHPRPLDVMPIRVRALAIAPGRPSRDLLLSPDHALALHGAFVPVRYLVNGATILRQDWHGRLAYYHVELDRHDVLLAEGLPAESYLDSGNRGAFADGAAATHLHPRFAPDAAAALEIWKHHACAPLLLDGPELIELRAALLRRAGKLGHAITEDPALRVMANDRPLPLLRTADRVRAHLPPRTPFVRLLSRSWTPLEMADVSADPRPLGIAVTGLRLGGRRLALNDARLEAGWRAPEPAWRWTGGDATVLTHGARVLEFRIAAVGRYWAGVAGTPRRTAGGG
jgi:serralysin